MSNLENIKVLASVAHESGSYTDSYKYHSQILENDINNAAAWINKGIAAAHLTNLDGGQINEAIQLIKKGCDLDKESFSEATAQACITAYALFISRLDDELLEKIKDHQKIAMPQNGSTLIHMMGQSVNKIVSAKNQAQIRMKALELLQVANDLSTSTATHISISNLIESLIKHSKSNGNYLESIQAIGLVQKMSTNLKSKIHPMSETSAKTGSAINSKSNTQGSDITALIVCSFLLVLMYPFGSWWKIILALILGISAVMCVYRLMASSK